MIIGRFYKPPYKTRTMLSRDPYQVVLKTTLHNDFLVSPSFGFSRRPHFKAHTVQTDDRNLAALLDGSLTFSEIRCPQLTAYLYRTGGSDVGASHADAVDQRVLIRAHRNALSAQPHHEHSKEQTGEYQRTRTRQLAGWYGTSHLSFSFVQSDPARHDSVRRMR
jgi:hypothetical protein